MKRHSKKHIMEALRYWTRELKKLDESAGWGILPSKFADAVKGLTEEELFQLWSILNQALKPGAVETALIRARINPTGNVRAALKTLN